MQARAAQLGGLDSWRQAVPVPPVPQVEQVGVEVTAPRHPAKYSDALMPVMEKLLPAFRAGSGDGV